jgi:hypothetical protein
MARPAAQRLEETGMTVTDYYPSEEDIHSQRADSTETGSLKESNYTDHAPGKKELARIP